jgi:hypothetical protein
MNAVGYIQFVWQVLLKILCVLQVTVYTVCSDCNYMSLLSKDSLHIKSICSEVCLLSAVMITTCTTYASVLLI